MGKEATVDPLNGSVMLPVWVETWLLGYKQSSQSIYARAIRRMIAGLEHFGGTDLLRCTQHQVLEVANWFDAQGVSNAVWNQTVSAWKSLFLYMVAENMRRMNPADRVQQRSTADRIQPTPTIKEVRRLWRGVTSEKVFQRSSAITQIRILRERALLALLVGAGLRAKEVLDLKCGQFDFGALIIRSVKRKRSREVDIPWHPSATRYLKPVISSNPDTPLFPSPNNPEQPIGYDTLARSLKQMCLACGVTVYTPHAFRRFAITDVANREGLVKAKEFADHVDITTTHGYIANRHERPTGHLHDGNDS